MGQALAELARLVGGTIEGDASLIISGVSGLREATEGQLSFFGNQKYKKALAETRASAVLVGPGAPSRGNRTWVHVRNPHLAWARIATQFQPPKPRVAGISPAATIGAGAKVDASASVAPGVFVGTGASVGARTVLLPGVYVGDGAVIGSDCTLGPNVSILERCLVGDRCILHAGVVIGADGFGFAFDAEKPEHFKIPQMGIVRVEEDVEIGANSCVDRATFGETVIGRGTKIDNLVQVAHNCIVGPYSILCAQVGLSGTTELGTGVVLGGQVGVAGHLRIGNMAKVGAQSGVMNEIEDGAEVLGSPAIPFKDSLRALAIVAKLPELNRELKDLRKRLEALEKKGTP